MNKRTCFEIGINTLESRNSCIKLPICQQPQGITPLPFVCFYIYNAAYSRYMAVIFTNYSYQMRHSAIRVVIREFLYICIYLSYILFYDLCSNFVIVARTAQNIMWPGVEKFQLGRNTNIITNFTGIGFPIMKARQSHNLFYVYHRDFFTWEGSLNIETGHFQLSDFSPVAVRWLIQGRCT